VGPNTYTVTTLVWRRILTRAVRGSYPSSHFSSGETLCEVENENI